MRAQRFAIPVLLTLVAPAVVAGAAVETLLVDCAGRTVRVAGGPGEDRRILAEGSLWDHPSMTSLRPPAAAGFDGCLVADLASDPERGLLYAAVAREARVDARGRRRHALVALRLPDLARQADADLGTAEGPVRLLLSPERDQLLASSSRYEGIGGEDAWRNLAQRFSTPALVPEPAHEDLRLATAPGRLPSSSAFSAAAVWASGGRVVDQTLVLDTAGRVLERLDPYALLPGKERRRLRALERAGAPGRRYLPMAFADATAERALFVVGHDPGPGTGAALFVYDFERGAALRPIRVPERVAAYDPTRRETPTAHLTPDGDAVLVEAFEWRPVETAPGETAPARVKTGRLALYELGTGARIRAFRLDPEPGLAARLIGYSAGGAIAWLGSRQGLYVVTLDGSRPPVALRPAGRFDPAWAVGVAESRR
jgi:hypothetical protein